MLDMSPPNHLQELPRESFARALVCRLLGVAAVLSLWHIPDLWAVKKDTYFPLVYLAVFIFLLSFRVIYARRKPSPAPRKQSAAAAPA